MPWNPETGKFERIRVSKDCGEEMMTQQHMKEHVDINEVVKRHASSGLYDHVNPVEPHFGDVSKAVDLQRAYDMVREVKEAFLELPPEVRAACDNDPIIFNEMLATTEGVEILADAGLPVTVRKPPSSEPAAAGEPASPSEPSVASEAPVTDPT